MHDAGMHEAVRVQKTTPETHKSRQGDVRSPDNAWPRVEFLTPEHSTICHNTKHKAPSAVPSYRAPEKAQRPPHLSVQITS